VYESSRKILEHCDEFLSTHLIIDEKSDKLDPEKLKKWLLLIVGLCNLPDECIYYHKYVIRLTNCIEELEGCLAAEKTLEEYIHQLKPHYNSGSSSCNKTFFGLIQYQMKLSWCNRNMEKLQRSLDQLVTVYESISNPMNKDDNHEVNDNCAIDIKNTIIEITQFALKEESENNDKNDVSSLKLVTDLGSLVCILNQTVFCKEFLHSNSFATKVWLSILIKCWTNLSKNNTSSSKFENKNEDSIEANKIMIEIVEGLEQWISMKEDYYSNLGPTEVANMETTDIQENRWVSEVSWTLSLQTNSCFLRQRLLFVASQSLIVVSRGKEELRNKECLSKILFCLTLELATLIKIFLDSSYKTINVDSFEEHKDKLIERVDIIVRYCFKILGKMRCSLGVRTKRLLLVYMVKGTFITSQNADYCHEILDNVVEYIKIEKTDFLLPQLISAVIMGNSQAQLPRETDFIVVFLKQSIEASVGEDKDPKQELMPACFSLIELLMSKLETESKNEKEEIIRVVGRVVQYVCLAFKQDTCNFSYPNECYTELDENDHYATNPFRKYVMVVTANLWNKSVAIESKSGYKSISLVNSQIKLKEFAKMLSKFLPQNSEVSRVIEENEIDNAA